MPKEKKHDWEMWEGRDKFLEPVIKMRCRECGIRLEFRPPVSEWGWECQPPTHYQFER
jgi:hypothetical protein